jgi:hypothetical protein
MSGVWRGHDPAERAGDSVADCSPGSRLGQGKPGESQWPSSPYRHQRDRSGADQAVGNASSSRQRWLDQQVAGSVSCCTRGAQFWSERTQMFTQLGLGLRWRFYAERSCDSG